MSGRQAVGTNDWEHAYQEYPRFAVTFAWTHVIDVLEKHPGERVYEVGGTVALAQGRGAR